MILIIQILFSAFFKIEKNLMHNFKNIDRVGAFYPCNKDKNV